jgi:ketosteroid isomerase-like protein
MTPRLPEILARYFAAQNRHDIDALIVCFAPDAAVHDEGKDIRGAAAIRTWKEATSRRYQVTVEPLDCRLEGDRTVVAAKVAGTFKGSPLVLTYRFGLTADERIGRLEIG